MLFIKEDDAICLNDGEDVIVFPLMQEELELMLNDTNYFCNYINLKYDSEDLKDTKVLDYHKTQLQKMKDDRENNIWHAIWVVASVKYRSIVGRINFVSTPDSIGSVNIDFFTGSSYRRQGIMTSAVELLSAWALDNGANIIVASTQKDNIPAHRVLENNDFEKTIEETSFVYKKERK